MYYDGLQEAIVIARKHASQRRLMYVIRTGTIDDGQYRVWSQLKTEHALRTSEISQRDIAYVADGSV